MSSEVLLALEGVSVMYGSMTAVSEVDLAVHAGEVVGLIGPNGAGKTSLVDGLTGFAAMTGRISINGTPVSRGVRPHAIAHRGLARTFQSLELFDDLTVRDNLLVVQGAQDTREQFVTRVDDTLRLLDLTGVRDDLVVDCPQGVRQFVSVARLLVAGAEVLVLDEPAAGLDQPSREKISDIVRGQADAGCAVLIIDHDLELVMRLCDRIYVMEDGGVIASGTPAEIRADDRVLSAYLGQR